MRKDDDLIRPGEVPSQERDDTAMEKMKPKEYFGFSEVLGYFFRKKGHNKTRNINLKMMHGINKISIIIFLLAFIFWLYRRLM